MRGPIGVRDELRPRGSERRRRCDAVGGKFRPPSAWSRRNGCRQHSASQSKASAKSPHGATIARPHCSLARPLRGAGTSTATGSVRAVPGKCPACRRGRIACRAAANVPPCGGPAPSDAAMPPARSCPADTRPSARTTRRSVAFQVSPAPLQTPQVPVHLGSIAGDDAVKRLAQEGGQRRCLTRGTHRKYREHAGDERPQPRLVVFLLGPRFVDAQPLLGGQSSRQRLIGWPQGRRDLVLDFHGQRRTTRLPQERAEEFRRPSFALAVESHQQGCQRHQSRSRLALRHADGQFRTRRRWYSVTMGLISGSSHT
jgi:hypothetical protein